MLRETLGAFQHAEPPDYHHRLAERNLERWRSQRGAPDAPLRIEVFQGDWGDVTLQCTRAHGVRFAVLNMANAHVPGGAYVEGGHRTGREHVPQGGLSLPGCRGRVR